MKKICLVCCFFFSSISIEAKVRDRVGAKAYEPCIYLAPTGQRLGDRLLEYIKAKWISHKTGLPLFVSPCKYYENLMLLEKERIVPSIPKRGVIKVHVENIPSFLEKTPNTFYVVSYYPFPTMDMLYEMKKDKVFINQIKETIAPNRSLELQIPPKDKISIAVHVRKGTGFDDPLKSVQIFNRNEIDTNEIVVSRKTYGDFIHPLKFPPEQYYIDQIKILSEYFDHQPLYVFIFTDDPKPFEILKRIKKEVSLENITFDCYQAVGTTDEEVQRDFFSMMQFDCLIRPGRSYFSTVSELISEKKITIYPKSYHFEIDKNRKHYLIMDNVQIVENL